MVRARVKKGIAKVERLSDELPASLDEFSRRVHRQLTRLEGEVDRAEARARREIARVLRQASHRLGRYEAEGEKRWKKLTAQARREALTMLRKLEKLIEPKASARKRGGAARGKRAGRRSQPAKRVAAAVEEAASTIAAG
jgi:molybdenum-dependent DNA-binding transcriptional regulator ModE